jgi:hypothetical protein
VRRASSAVVVVARARRGMSTARASRSGRDSKRREKATFYDSSSPNVVR